MTSLLAGGTSKTKTSSASSVNVPSYLQDAQDAFNSRLNDFATQEYTPYTGEGVAPLNALQNQSIAGVAGLQGSTDQGFNNVNSILNGLVNKYSNGLVTPDSIQQFMNPYQQNVIDVNKNQAVQDYQGQLNDANDQAMNIGAFGGDRSAIVQGQLQKNLNTNLQNIQNVGDQANYQQASQMALQNGQQSISALSGLATGIGQATTNQQASQLQNYSALMNAGNVQQAQQQAEDTYGLQQYAQQQAYDPQSLSQLLSLMQPYFGSNSSGTSSTQTSASLMSTLMGVASAAGSFFGGSGSGSPTAGIGGGSAPMTTYAGGAFGSGYSPTSGGGGISWMNQAQSQSNANGAFRYKKGGLAKFASGGAVGYDNDGNLDLDSLLYRIAQKPDSKQWKTSKFDDVISGLNDFLGGSSNERLQQTKAEWAKRRGYDESDIPTDTQPAFFTPGDPSKSVQRDLDLEQFANEQDLTDEQNARDNLVDGSDLPVVDVDQATHDKLLGTLDSHAKDAGLSGVTQEGDSEKTPATDDMKSVLDLLNTQNAKDDAKDSNQGDFLGFKYDKGLMALAGGILSNAIQPPGVALGKGIETKMDFDKQIADQDLKKSQNKFSNLLAVMKEKEYARQNDLAEVKSKASQMLLPLQAQKIQAEIKALEAKASTDPIEKSALALTQKQVADAPNLYTTPESVQSLMQQNRMRVKAMNGTGVTGANGIYNPETGKVDWQDPA